VAKHLIDTDLYIDLIQSGTTLPLIRELYDKDAPGIYFSSVVAQELLAGARSPAGKKRVEILFRPFERVGRVVTPSHNQRTPEEFWPRFWKTGRISKANCQP
jgi:predicted nucleic acid-binding protein